MPTRILSSALLLAALLLLTSCEVSQNELRLVVPYAPVDRAIVEDLTALLGDTDSTVLDLVGTAESEEAALDAVTSGDADLALVSNSLPFRDDVATVMPLYPTVLHIAYREDRDPSSGLTLLSDARIYAGPIGSASRIIFERIVDHLGLDTGTFEYVGELTDHPDVVIVFAPVSQEIFLDYPDYRLFSLGEPSTIGIGSIIDAAVLLNPHFRPFVIPAGTYGVSTPDPVVTIAVDKILVTRSNLDDSVVYDLINDILRLRPALAAKRPGLFQRLSGDFDASRSRFVLHAGTQAYLQREAPTIYERYSGIAEVGVTVLIALFSASLAGVRILQRRRKNRIDRFYSAAIEIRDSITHQSSDDDTRQAVAKVRALQNDAFDQLVHEKLAADESFRIFITLSNDVLRQLGESGTGERLSDV